jgi:hypothetical protein
MADMSEVATKEDLKQLKAEMRVEWKEDMHSLGESLSPSCNRASPGSISVSMKWGLVTTRKQRAWTGSFEKRDR